jgi:hypothetical protein
MKFRATIELAGKTATGIDVPAAVVTKLGSSKKPAVGFAIMGYTYRSTVGLDGRAIHASHQPPGPRGRRRRCWREG